MAFTVEQLNILESAVAAGRTEVSYQGRTVRYNTTADLLKALDIVRSDVNSTTGKVRTRQVRVYTLKGFNSPCEYWPGFPLA